MRSRFKIWQLVLVAIVLCAGAFWFFRGRPLLHLDAAGLVQCLPPDQATHVYIDVDALRKSGILALVAGSKASEDADYRTFVEQTGFDYRTDLNGVAAAFLHGNEYFAIRGKFDSKRLSQYAASQGGHCTNGICDMPASTPDRHISFYSLQPDVLAMAVSVEERGVNLIGPAQWKNPPQLPPQPIWISAPSFAFTDVKSLPTGTHSFLSPLAQAQKIVFTVGPDGDRIQIRLEVSCANAETAAAVAAQLTNTTELLKKMMARDHITPNSGDLTGVLAGGAFQQKDQNVTGTWPVERKFVEAFTGGVQ